MPIGDLDGRRASRFSKTFFGFWRPTRCLRNISGKALRGPAGGRELLRGELKCGAGQVTPGWADRRPLPDPGIAVLGGEEGLVLGPGRKGQGMPSKGPGRPARASETNKKAQGGGLWDQQDQPGTGSLLGVQPRDQFSAILLHSLPISVRCDYNVSRCLFRHRALIISKLTCDCPVAPMQPNGRRARLRAW
jgi:hypothetical protein